MLLQHLCSHHAAVKLKVESQNIKLRLQLEESLITGLKVIYLSLVNYMLADM